ncbi:MAG: YodL domain-containing protein [Lachnospiraceae bacterium]
MKVKIYQINTDRDSERLKFCNLETTHNIQKDKEINASIYDKVLDADIDETNLEDIYYRFNTSHHPLFRGHSLSVSDVVVKDDGAFFCDSIGFKKINFDESQAHIPDNTFKIVYVEPHKPAYATEIGSDYKSLSRAVKGLIEPIYDTDDNTVYVGNEESKLIGMPGNRHMSNGHGIIAGPFLVIGDDGEEFRSLTDEEINKYVEKFSQPEDISDEEVQNDTGYSIFGFTPNM